MKTHGTSNALTNWLNGSDLELMLKGSDYKPDMYLGKPEPFWFSVRGMEGCKFFFSDKDRLSICESSNAALHDLYGAGCKSFCDEHPVPGEEKFIKAEQLLAAAREIHKTFFSTMVHKGYVDSDLFNDLIKPYLNGAMTFSHCGEPFHLGFEFKFNPAKHICVQDFIEVRYIIMPCLQPNDRTFEMMRICPKCGKFFIALTSKTTFCSPSCRSIALRKKSKGG